MANDSLSRGPGAEDQRKKKGGSVMAKAMHVTAIAECARRYGTLARTKMVPGIVFQVLKEINRSTGRAVSYVVADYYFGSGVIKRCKLTTRSVVSSEFSHLHGELRVFLEQRHGFVSSAQEDVTPLAPAVLTLGTGDENGAGVASLPNEEDGGLRRIDDGAAATEAPGDVPTPSVVVHDTTWHHDNIATLHDVNGPVLQREWQIRDEAGNLFGPSSPLVAGQDTMSRLDYFLLMFPPTHLQDMARLTNTVLAAQSSERTSCGELLKFFGILILASKFEFKSIRSLWSTTAPSKYIPAPAFGRTGMARRRFDDLWKCIRWSNQPSERPDGMTSEQYRWRLVDDFVDKFNEHRAAAFQPSELLCVDESISRWYGKGGHWINRGLPMYVAIDRKPENGCEIQTAACGRSGIVIRLKLVKNSEEEDHQQQVTEESAADEQTLLHGASVMKELVLPWLHTDRIVCGDSYFASVPAAQMLSRNGMRFIGVVKTATRQFPMAYLSRVELQDRGDRKGLVARGDDGQSSLLAFVWMDRQRRYFISTASSLDVGIPYTRLRWRQVDESPNAEPTRVELTVSQPKAAQIYHDACAMVDRHNRHRQDTLGLEVKLGTHNWGLRVNLSIFGMIVVDTWLAYSQCTGATENQKDFYTSLSEELIDNTFDHAHNRRRRQVGEDQQPGMNASSPEPCDSRTRGNPRVGTSAHLTPTKRKKTNRDGEELTYSLQGRCKVCRKLTTYACSLCMDENPSASEFWMCYTKKGRLCFATHVEACHNEH